MLSSAIGLAFLRTASAPAGLQEARELLRADIASLTLGIVITGIGLAANAHLPPDSFADALLGELSKWSGGGRPKGRPQEDDLTLVVIDAEDERLHS